MTQYHATPETLDSILPRLAAGDTVVFAPGRYTHPIQLHGVAGTAAAPITLRAMPGAIITAHADPAAYSIEPYRLDGNLAAQERQQAGLFPSQKSLLTKGQLSIKDSRHLVLDGFRFEQAWPTHIRIENSQHLTVRNSQFEGGTYAITAFGEQTQHLTFDRVSWRQDARIWNGIPWASIHGSPPEDAKVDPQNDWRLFDGGFFTGWSIKGDIAFTRLDVRDAFNGIQMFRQGPNEAALSQNIRISDSRFERIRDNVIEPEQGGHRWIIENNRFTQVYKPFAFEHDDPSVYTGFVLRNNVIAMPGRPGPQGDIHTQMRVFKFPPGVELVDGLSCQDNRVTPPQVEGAQILQRCQQRS